MLPECGLILSSLPWGFRGLSRVIRKPGRKPQLSQNRHALLLWVNKSSYSSPQLEICLKLFFFLLCGWICALRMLVLIYILPGPSWNHWTQGLHMWFLPPIFSWTNYRKHSSLKKYSILPLRYWHAYFKLQNPLDGRCLVQHQIGLVIWGHYIKMI